MLKKTAVTLVIVLLIGATTAFATSWTSSATGSCTYNSITFYPWHDWLLNGTWNDGTFHGTFTGTTDSTKQLPDGFYAWYHGIWTLYVSGVQITLGNYHLRSITDLIGSTTWNGTWYDTQQNCDCGTGGTLSGFYDAKSD